MMDQALLKARLEELVEAYERHYAMTRAKAISAIRADLRDILRKEG